MSPSEILERLKEPFPAECIEWRIGQSGKTRDGRPFAKVLAYLTNRAIMDRLDEVFGVAGWENRFEKAPNDPKGESLICGIGAWIGDRQVWKWDGAANTDFEAVKGGISDSMKRAAVQFAIGRYLYGIGESWADCTEENMRGQDGWRYAKTKDGVFWWKPPALPAWAVPQAKPSAPVDNVRLGTEFSGDGHEGGSSADKWLTPPDGVTGPDGFHCMAVREMLRLAGATTAQQKRDVLSFLKGAPVKKEREVIDRAEYAFKAWQKFREYIDGGKSLDELLVDSQRAGATT